MTLLLGLRHESTPENMAEYLLTARAESDLDGIYEFSEAKFGRYQAEAYAAGFKRTFDLLAHFPLIGRAADDLVPGYRRYRFQSHYIFYTGEPDHVLIRALPHTAQNLRPELFR